MSPRRHKAGKRKRPPLEQAPAPPQPAPRVPQWVRDYWPVVLALLALWVATAVILHRALRDNQGLFIYSLDDAYIHMALAKHLVEDGVWGVTRYGFSSSQSSLLWPLLVAAVYLAVGAKAAVPALLNVLFTSLLVWYMFAVLRRWQMPSIVTAVVLIELVVFAFLPRMVFDGMEHALHSLISLALVHVSARALSADRPRRRQTVGVLALALLAAATRYESLFVVAALAPLFLLRRRWLSALALPAAAVIPLIAYGIVSQAHGGGVLPNSVALKSNLSGLLPSEGFGTELMESLVAWLFVPGAILLLVNWRRGVRQPEQMALLVFLAVCLLQVAFANLRQYRYQSYLLTLGLYAVSVSLVAALRAVRVSEVARVGIAAAAMGLLLLTLTGREGIYWIRVTPLATSNIYQQQYQMARFFRQYYNGQAVAANDVGAINYYADIRLLDLVGLGTQEVATARRNHAYTTDVIRSLARERDVRIAIVYAHWFNEVGGLPQEWVAAAQWRIPHNIAAGFDTVTIYAVDPAEAPRLMEHLREFSPSLPPQVEQRIARLP